MKYHVLFSLKNNKKKKLDFALHFRSKLYMSFDVNSIYNIYFLV